MLFFFSCSGDHRDLHSFPTRRSSDLWPAPASRTRPPADVPPCPKARPECRALAGGWRWARGRSTKRNTARAAHPPDRKSTRLNSSHQIISYAVFCLKKKKDNKKKETE